MSIIIIITLVTVFLRLELFAILLVHSKTHEGEYYVVFISVSFSACSQVPYREYKCLIWSKHSVNIYYMNESSEYFKNAKQIWFPSSVSRTECNFNAIN